MNQINNKLWSKEYIILIMTSTFSSFSFSMVMTILSKYLVNMGATLIVAGIVTGIFSITALIIRPISGYVADKYNKRNILMISIYMIGVCVLGYSISNIGAILCFRILHGIAFAICGTASIALASDYIPKGRLGEGIGYLGLGQIISSAVAPGFGIFTTDQFGNHATFMISCMMAVISASLLFLIKPGKQAPIKKQAAIKISMKDLVAKEALSMSVICGLISFMNGVVVAYLVLYAQQRHIQNVSIYFTVSAVVMLLVRPLSGKIMDKKGLSVLVYPGFIAGIAAMILHGTATSLWILLLAAVLKSLAQGCIQPSMQAECIKRVSSDRIGVATSTFYIGADVGQGVGPVIGGAIASSFQYSTMFYFCGALLLLGCFLYFASTKMHKEKLSEKLE